MESEPPVTTRPPTKCPPEMLAWPAELTELAQQIARLERASRVPICDAARAEALRQRARALTVELEARKAALISAECNANPGAA